MNIMYRWDFVDSKSITCYFSFMRGVRIGNSNSGSLTEGMGGVDTAEQFF